MKIASIDIGTNTILLLIAEVQHGVISHILHDQQVFARLGKGVDADRIINQETFIRAEGFLRQYKTTCDSYGVERICATGTSALRDASNKEEFIAYIAERTGITIEVLSGEDEALWTYRGGISEFTGRAEKFSVIDIGGGSTEIILGTAEQITAKTSIDLGSVRLTERILKDSPPEIPALLEAHALIASLMPPLTKQTASTFAVGVAGTVTTLAALHQQLPRYMPERVSGYLLHRDDIGAMFGMLKDKSVAQILAFPQITTGRADIILAGIMILMGYMESSGLNAVTVSDRGLRYGILLREAERVA